MSGGWRAGEEDPPAEATGGDVEEFVRRRGPVLVALARTLLRDPATAEDVVAGVLARVLPRWTRPGDDDPEVLTTRWLVQACTSWRPGWPGARTVDGTVGGGDGGHGPREGDHDELLAQVRALPGRQRAVLALRHVAGMDDAHIAEVLEEEPAVVAQHAHRAVAALHRTGG